MAKVFAQTKYDNQSYVLTSAIASARVGKAPTSEKTVIQATIRVNIPEYDGLYYCPTSKVGLRDPRVLAGETGILVPQKVRLVNDGVIVIAPGVYDVPVTISMNGTTDVTLEEDIEKWQSVVA